MDTANDIPLSFHTTNTDDDYDNSDDPLLSFSHPLTRLWSVPAPRPPSSTMPPKPGSSLFLGLELATDQLRASIVDENLELVGVESVDFDTELAEYQ